MCLRTRTYQMRQIMFILILTGCSSFQYYTPSEYPQTHNLSIEFGYIPNKDHAGLCFYDKNAIVIDINHWRLLSPNQKVILLAHEIGHCLYHWEHVNYTDVKGCPTSVMFWQIPPKHCLGE